jgi:hypothetical protein
MPARPKGAIGGGDGIRPVNGPAPAPTAGPTPPPLDEFLPRQERPKFDFAQDLEEPRRPPDISATVDEGGTFHIFSLIVKALRKVDRPTRRRIIGLLNELEMDQ